MISFIFTQCTVNQYLYNVETNIIEALAKTIKNPDLLGGPVFCSWWRITIHFSPLLGSNCPTLWLSPLSLLSHPLSPHYTIYNNCLPLCCDCMYGEYWFRLSRYVYDVNRSFASYTKTKSVESAVWCLLTRDDDVEYLNRYNRYLNR
jgi:hypothetical protein